MQFVCCTTAKIYPTNTILIKLLLIIFSYLLGKNVIYCEELSWVLQPSDSSSVEGGTATLNCRVRNRDGSQVVWFRIVDNEIEHLFVDSKQFTTDERLSVFRYEDGYDLIIEDIQRKDDADYECSIARSDLKKRVHLTVLVPPENPVMVLNNTEMLIENQHVSFNCSSKSGNPAPSFLWLKNNVKLDNYERHPSLEKFGVSYSVMSYQIDQSDHNANISCSVNNEANQSSSIYKIILVQYSPIVSLGNHNPLKVVEGEQLVLDCSINAFPQVLANNVMWIKDGEVNGDGFTYNINEVQVSDSGLYSCSCSNIIGKSLADVHVEVQYPPKLSFIVPGNTITNNEVKIKEGSDLEIACSCVSNPPIEGRLTWYHNSREFSVTGDKVIIKDVTPSYTGIYTCSANNVLKPSLSTPYKGQSNSSLSIVVLYKPGTATISGQHHVMRNDNIEMKCILDDPGMPPADIFWSKLGAFGTIADGESLYIENVQLDSDATYICEARNVVGEGVSSTFQVTVQEKPNWMTNGQLNSEKTVLINQNDVFTICSARGRPLPTVKWFKDGQEILLSNDTFEIKTDHSIIDKKSFVVTSTLFWKGSARTPRDVSIQLSDSDMYSCQIENEVSSQVLSSSMSLTVQYPPILNKSESKRAVDLSNNAQLTCEADSSPKCSFTWYNNTTIMSDNDRVKIQLIYMDNSKFPYKSVINIENVETYDLIEYVCVARNTYGEVSHGISLTNKRRPEMPTELRVLSKTWESIYLEWIAGFDGGYTQIYYVTKSSNNYSSHTFEVENPWYNVTNLLPSTQYNLIVNAKNKLGTGDSSNLISTYTNAFLLDPPTDVYFDRQRQKLTFHSSSNGYCARIEILRLHRWHEYEKCAPTVGGSIKLHSTDLVSVRIALCLLYRNEICSSRIEAFIMDPPPDDLSVETIIIVACICSLIVLVLLIILIYLCWRRYEAKKNDELIARQRLEAARNEGFDNPVIDKAVTEKELHHNVFTTNNSGICDDYLLNENKKFNCNAANINAHGVYLPPYNNLELQSSFNSYDKSDFRGDGSKKPSSIQSDKDSGVCIPDPNKPKKIIYEVIV